MAKWTMRFRVGRGGTDMWPQCLRYGVAAITYYSLADVDLRDRPPGEPKEHWNRLASSCKYSLAKIAYEMQRGDTIYVRDKGHITGKGTVMGSYFFDQDGRIIDDNGMPWAHQVPVDWQHDFPCTKIGKLGPVQFTVWKLSAGDATRIEKSMREARKRVEKVEAMEGDSYTKEATFRSRNRTLIAAKKAQSDGLCEVCRFSFTATYGRIGQGYIIAHHVDPIGNRSQASKTTLDDIVLVCANCHAMLHTENPPLSMEYLRALLKR